jgi:hypothetical protein
LQRDPAGFELRADPTALAPERLLVFEVRGAIAPFAAAVRRVPGLELIDEEELAGDDEDKAPVAYLMVPDVRALREIESLWSRWRRGQLVSGETASSPRRRTFSPRKFSDVRRMSRSSWRSNSSTARTQKPGLNARMKSARPSLFAAAG